MQIYNRSTKELIELQDYGSGSLKFLYHTVFGRFILQFLVARSVSKIASLYYNSSLSKGKIDKFVKQYKMEISYRDIKKFRSFNDFFTRKPDLKNKPIQKSKAIFGSVADARLLVKDIDENLFINIKNTVFTTQSLLADDETARIFKDGTCLIFRLAMDDNHHFTFPDAGKLVKNYKIAGKLHSVQPITNRQCKVFTENSREVSILETANFGTIAYVEIGALLAGKITNIGKKKFIRGDEKGNFGLGGSAIILLVEKDRFILDKDIIEYSNRGIETFIKVNEKIGLRK